MTTIHYAIFIVGGVLEDIDAVDATYDFQKEANELNSGQDNDLYRFTLDLSTAAGAIVVDSYTYEHVPEEDHDG